MEFFYQEIPYREILLSRSGSGITLEGEGLQVTALKKSFDRTGYILRFVNLSDEEVQAVVHFTGVTVHSLYQTNLRETARKELKMMDHKVQLSVRAKEIVTLFLK